MEAQENGGLHSESFSKLQIVAIMSVPPLKVTEPRKCRKILVSDQQIGIIQGSYQIVLYYEKLKEEKESSCLAGWIVESLSIILLDYPLISGRIQQREVDGVKGLEIVSNDSGIRLLEAHYPTSLSQFLQLNERENLEPQLVFWKDIDPQYPQFSPLFYVQVTNFECGGYSIGISCSLLLADILLVDNFLQKWAKLHIKMLPQNEEHNTPIFYHPRLKNPEPLSSDIISPTQSQNGIQSMVFKITPKNDNFFKESYRELAMLCVEDVEQRLNLKMGSDFSLVLNESPNVIKVESFLKSNENGINGLGPMMNEISCSTWNEFGVYEVEFHKGNKATQVSCWIGSIFDGHVMAIPLLSTKENACAVIVVSPPHFS